MSGRGRAKRNPPSNPIQPSLGHGIQTQPGPSFSTGGRPAGLSSDDDSDDDGFFISKPSSKPTQRPGTAPVSKSSGSGRTEDVGGSYVFGPTVRDPKDPLSSSTTSNWGGQSRSSVGVVSTKTSVSPSSGSKFVNGRDSFPVIPDLDAPVMLNMAAINKSWNNGFPVNRDACLAYISVALRNVFQSCSNPYSAGLYFMGFSDDFFVCKQGTLSNQVMTELKKWLLERGVVEHEQRHLNKSLQIIAFDIVTRQRNTLIIKLVCEIYRLDKVKDELVEPIMVLCTRGLFKEACLTAGYLGLQPKFSIHDFVVPLILQDREFIVEEYLSTSKAKQMDLISFLDGMLDESKNSYQAMNEYVRSRELTQVKMEKMQLKPLLKLVTRLIEKFKADPIKCPNFSRKKRSAALRHLVYRKYVADNPLNDDCFEELCDSTVLDDPILQDELLYLMRSHDDIDLAAKFALRHAIALDRVSSDIQRKMHDLNPSVVPLVSTNQSGYYDDEDWETDPSEPKQIQPSAPTTTEKLSPTSPKKPSPEKTRVEEKLQLTDDEMTDVVEPPVVKPQYYKIPLADSNIHYMDSPFGVESFLQHLHGAYVSQKMSGGRQDFIIVSIDAEWKPMMFEKNNVALIQIGLEDEVYLLDIIKLKAYLKDNQTAFPVWEEMRMNFFANERVVKLGYGIEGDIKILSQTHPQWQNTQEHFKCFLDLSKVAKALVKANEKFFPYTSGNSANSTGLSELVRATFGKPLSKEEQMSNWEKRPLRDAQLKYAAADAYVLMELFAFMNRRSQEVGIDLEGIVLGLLHSPKVSNVVAKKKKSSSTSIIHKLTKTARFVPGHSPFQVAQRACDIKIICDNMVQGLGKHLRSCGIDTRILGNDEDHDRCAIFASREERYILTRGSVYTQLSSQFPELHFLNVTCDKLEDQLHDVLSFFNLSISEADIFSRCQKCNGGTFISVSGKTMEYLFSHRNGRNDGNSMDDNVYVSEGTMLGEITFSTENGHIVKSWNLLPENMINSTDLCDIRTSDGASIVFDKITPEILKRINVFIVCDKCGKIYWDGSHLKRVLEGKSVIPVPKKANLPGDSTDSPASQASGGIKSGNNSSDATKSTSSPNMKQPVITQNTGGQLYNPFYSDNGQGTSSQLSSSNTNVSPYELPQVPQGRPKSSPNRKEWIN